MTARPHKTTLPGHASTTVLALIRILIASYFLAKATGLIFNTTGVAFFTGILPVEDAHFVTTVFLYAVSFAIMVGYMLRLSALLLAVYIFWSSFVHFTSAETAYALAEFWRDIALLSSVLLIAVTEPGGSKTLQLWRRTITPRRVTRRSSHAARPQQAITEEDSLRQTFGPANRTGAAVRYQETATARPSLAHKKAAAFADLDEVRNIFAEDPELDPSRRQAASLGTAAMC